MGSVPGQKEIREGRSWKEEHNSQASCYPLPTPLRCHLTGSMVSFALRLTPEMQGLQLREELCVLPGSVLFWESQF